MFRLLHHGLCSTLSAALLLTNGLPMAVQHAHPVGANLSHHTHDLGHAPGAKVDSFARHDAVAVSPASVTEVTEHIHLLWLGMEFTFPAPKGHQPNTSVTVSAGGMLARLADQGACDVSSKPVPTLLADLPVIGDLCDGVAPPVVEVVRPRELASLPLCETARHARSGVQLI